MGENTNTPAELPVCYLCYQTLYDPLKHFLKAQPKNKSSFHLRTDIIHCFSRQIGFLHTKIVLLTIPVRAFAGDKNTGESKTHMYTAIEKYHLS